jgi:hypothetical protein
MWQEVYLSALLRAILYADDANYVRWIWVNEMRSEWANIFPSLFQRLAGFRKLDPIATLDAELRFIAAAEAAFFKGDWGLRPRVPIQANSLALIRMATRL